MDPRDQATGLTTFVVVETAYQRIRLSPRQRARQEARAKREAARVRPWHGKQRRYRTNESRWHTRLRTQHVRQRYAPRRT